jgi:hypothetical protein
MGEGDIAKYDQALARLCHSLPSAVAAMYRAFVDEGFGEEAAFQLARDFMALTLGKAADYDPAGDD